MSKLKKLIREPKQIAYTILKQGRGEQQEQHQVKTKDVPLNDFTESLDKLGGVCARLLCLGEDWAKEVMCKGIDEISYSSSGVRSVRLSFVRNFSHFNAPFEGKTPMFPIDDLDSSEVTSKKYPNINDDDMDLIIAFIDASIAYTDGNRAQGELSLDDDPYAPAPNSVQEGDDLDFDKTNLEAHFHKRVDACKTQLHLVTLVEEVFKQDWNGSDMKLPDLKIKAKNHYSQNRESLETN